MLTVRGLTKRFGATTALSGVNLDLAVGETVSVLGPSGSGKSTLLRVIGGLEPADAGSVSWDGADLTIVPAHERQFGLMFQDYALFPHRNVAGNVGFGLRMAGWSPSEVARRVEEVLELVGLSGMNDRRTNELSGGEAQRVALARTLAPAPRLVMLDEPLGSLDRSLRERLIIELGEIFEQVESTVLYVTHDQEEAFTIADRVAIMREGELVQEATPEDLWSAPAGVFISDFLGFSNRFAATAVDGRADLGWTTVPVEVADGPCQVVLRPDALTLDEHGDVSVTVVGSVFRGDHYLARTTTATGAELSISMPTRPRPGEVVRIRIDPAGVLTLVE
ncbi:MAG: ABC transporter ATP-binding protein [Acidimicrobiia bacterium]|nr:ABC transporter ATP-binding protein [Acidimicrobiia bacterium]NNF89490.1 ABC transporter ATP-binding protein [Acidimicrobiia bacterium]NNL13304.1 ABC transporter ATP-binding protein [Acidimicrobiia bacterium]